MWGGDGPLPVVPGVQLVNQVSRTVTVCQWNRRQPVCLIIPLNDTMLGCMPVPMEEARVGETALETRFYDDIEDQASLTSDN